MSTIDVGIADKPQAPHPDTTASVVHPSVASAPGGVDFYVGSVKIEHQIHSTPAPLAR